MIETKAIARLAKAAGKTYGIGAIIVTHGECDASNENYENELHQLWQDYNADLSGHHRAKAEDPDDRLPTKLLQ